MQGKDIAAAEARMQSAVRRREDINRADCRPLVLAVTRVSRPGAGFRAALEGRTQEIATAMRSNDPPLKRSGMSKPDPPRGMEPERPRIRFHDLHPRSAFLNADDGRSTESDQKGLGHAAITVSADTQSHVIGWLHGEAAEDLADADRNWRTHATFPVSKATGTEFPNLPESSSKRRERETARCQASTSCKYRSCDWSFAFQPKCS